MAKQLYDPHMFNYMWESCIPSDDFIVGTYYIEDMVEGQDFIDHLGQVERLAPEGSTVELDGRQGADAGGARAADEQGAGLLRDPGAARAPRRPSSSSASRPRPGMSTSTCR